MANKIDLKLELDLDLIQQIIDESKDLANAPEFFSQLSLIAVYKKQLNNALDVFEGVESKVKNLINDKAKGLYGEQWTAIKGDGYKIVRVFTGSVYEIADQDKVKQEFLNIKVTPKTEAIEEFVKTENKLPEGIEPNMSRGENIRISINGNSENND